MEPIDAKIKTTALSLEILQIIHDRSGATMPEIATSVNRANSNVHNHLQTLREYGYVRKTGNEYRLGYKLLNLGIQARNRITGYNCIEQEVFKIAMDTSMVVDFTVEDRGRLIRLCSYSDNFEMHIGDPSHRIGGYHHMHSTANGKAILAEWTRDQVQSVIDEHGLPRKTQNTITDPETLHSQLEIVRNQGFALNDQEDQDGMRAVGATIEGPNGDAIGAISFGGPIYLLTDSIFREDIPERLMGAIADIEERIGTLDNPYGAYHTG